MDFSDITNEIISQIIENAYNAVDACDDSTSQIILDVCGNEADAIISQIMETTYNDSDASSLAINELMLDGCSSEILIQTVENDYNDVDASEGKADEIITQTIETASVDACEDTESKIIVDADVEEIIPQTIKTASTDACEGTVNKIIVDAIVAEPEEIIPLNIETASIDACMVESANKIIVDTCVTQVDEIISPNIETAIDLDAVKLATNEIMLDRKSSEILIQTVENEYNDVNAGKGKADEITQQTIEVASVDACEDMGSKIIVKKEDAISACLVEAEEIINQIVDSVYDLDNCDVDATSLDSNNEIERQSLYDADAKSDASLIVESVDCIDPNTKNGIDEDKKIVATSEAESDDSIVVECIETCNNEEMITPAVITSESSDQPRVDENVPKTDVEQSQIEIEGSTNAVCELPSTDEFYSDELLRCKGYNMQMFTNAKRFVNLMLPADPKNKSKIQCTGLSCGVTANEVIPLLDKCGQVFDLRIVADTGVIVVTYMTEKECENAIQLLDGREFQGKVINVVKFVEKTRLIVRPISIDAQKPELFIEFRKLTKGLDSVLLPYAPDSGRHNRGYCYLDYIGHEEAAKAKKTLSSMNYNGQRVFCDWAEHQPGEPRQNTATTMKSRYWRKLFMKNLHPEMSVSDIRRIFSVYGEILEIDKSDNWASVKFQNPDDAMQAFQNVDRKLLGNKNVELSRTFVPDTFSQGSSEKPSTRFQSHDNRTHRFGSNENPTQRFEPGENSNAMHRKPIVESSTKLYGTRQSISSENNSKADRNECHGKRNDMATSSSKPNRNDILPSNNNRLECSDNNTTTMKSAAQVFFLKK